jgi:hypothetical protein
MLRLRDGIFSAGHTNDSPFVGFHLGANNENDGMKFSRKVMVAKVVTNPAAAETIAVGGNTYTFRVSPTLDTEIKIGNLMTDGNFANANADAVWKNYGNWTIDATGALHTAGVASGTVDAVSDYRATVGGTVLITDTTHGLSTGNTVTIAGTTSYNGTYTIVKVDANSFYIFALWVANETGTWTSPAFVQTLVQEWFPKPVVGRSYEVIFTISGRSAGTVTPSIGGVAGTARGADATYTETIVATTDGYLTFTPTTDFDGKVSAITVTDSITDLTELTAIAIAERVNLDTTTSLCTAYVGANAVGKVSEILLIANTIGITPTFTADGAKVISQIDWTLTLLKADVESSDYFAVNNVTDASAKPTVLVERNSGTDKNFLY